MTKENITIGFSFAVTSKIAVQENGEPPSLAPDEEPELAFEIVEQISHHAEDEVISESLDSTSQKEEPKEEPKEKPNEIKVEKVKLFRSIFKKKTAPPSTEGSLQESEVHSAGDQTDAVPPASDPQPVSTSITSITSIVFLSSCFPLKIL